MKDLEKLVAEARTDLEIREEIFNSNLIDCHRGKELEAKARKFKDE